MIYYQVLLYTNKKDLDDGLQKHGGLKGIKWLVFEGDDKGMQIGEDRNDESLAIQILLQNLDKVESELISTNNPFLIDKIGIKRRYVENEDDLIDLLYGEYEATLVKKLESELLVGKARFKV